MVFRACLIHTPSWSNSRCPDFITKQTIGEYMRWQSCSKCGTRIKHGFPFRGLQLLCGGCMFPHFKSDYARGAGWTSKKDDR